MFQHPKRGANSGLSDGPKQQGSPANVGTSYSNWQSAFNSRYGGRNYSDDQFASRVFGDIARKDWQDYKNTFMPVHSLFTDAVMNNDLTKQQLERIPGNIEQQFSQVQGQHDARNARMGLANIEPVNSSSSQGLSTVFAENQARSHGKERRMSAIAGANITPQDTRVNQ